jgi:hypothetical protein
MAGLFGRRPSLSFECLATSLIVVREHKLGVQLFAGIATVHGVATYHVVNGGGGLMVVAFAAAVGAVVSGVAVEAVSPAVAPICRDWARFGAIARWWRLGRRPGGGKGSGGCVFALNGGAKADLLGRWCIRPGWWLVDGLPGWRRRPSWRHGSRRFGR